MPKITFIGAGSTVFAKNILGDSMCTPALQDAEMALYDIDETRLKESAAVMRALNRNINGGRAKIKTHLGTGQRRKALAGADFVVNAIQVGGYDPCTITDFEIPKKYGLRQTIADTIGIGGIFRVLRTMPVMLDFARDMEKGLPQRVVAKLHQPHVRADRRHFAPNGRQGRRSLPLGAGLCHDAAPKLRHTGRGKEPAVENCRHQPHGVAVRDHRRRQGSLPRDKEARAEKALPLGAKAPRKFRYGAPLHDAQLRLLHHGIFRASLRIRALLYQIDLPAFGRRIQHSPRRIPAALRESDRSLERPKEIAAGCESYPQAHARVRLAHHGGHHYRPIHCHRRQRAQQRPDHQPTEQCLRRGFPSRR